MPARQLNSCIPTNEAPERRGGRFRKTKISLALFSPSWRKISRSHSYIVSHTHTLSVSLSVSLVFVVFVTPRVIQKASPSESSYWLALIIGRLQPLHFLPRDPYRAIIVSEQTHSAASWRFVNSWKSAVDINVSATSVCRRYYMPPSITITSQISATPRL